LQNQLTDSITYTTIEPRDEGSLVRVIAYGKKPEPVGGTVIKITQARGNPEVEHKPDTLIGSQVTISRSFDGHAA
jgi:hypothetical protein